MVWARIFAAHLQVCSAGSMNKTIFAFFYVIPQLFADRIIILLPNIKKWSEVILNQYECLVKISIYRDLHPYKQEHIKCF